MLLFSCRQAGNFKWLRMRKRKVHVKGRGFSYTYLTKSIYQHLLQK